MAQLSDILLHVELNEVTHWSSAREWVCLEASGCLAHVTTTMTVLSGNWCSAGTAGWSVYTWPLYLGGFRVIGLLI